MLEVAQNWKNCSKVAEHNRDRPRDGERGGGGKMVGRRAQIYESAFFFVRALVHDAVVVSNFLSRFLGNPGREEVSETP